MSYWNNGHRKPPAIKKRRQVQDRPMYAPDMFEPGTQQIFSVRTGDFIGYQRTGQFWAVEQEPEPEPGIDPVNIDQLTLF